MTPDDRDIDDAPPPNEESVDAELARMNENDWLELKNDLQEYLNRITHSEDPAYKDADIITWIDENGKYFDLFYQALRQTKPEWLLSFRKKAFDENEVNGTEFIREWNVFRDKMRAST